MAISFACPNCKALVQVGDELAEQVGKCPRCERLVIIPSNAKPMPILLDAEGNPVPNMAPVNPPSREQPHPKASRYDEPRRPRRREPIEKKPSGPIWPWALGIFAGLAVIGLLLSSFITLFAYRPPEPRANIQTVTTPRPKIDAAPLGQLVGNRVILQDGVFQIRTTLNLNDELNPIFNRRQKRFVIELRGAIAYHFDVDSNVLSSVIRLEDRAGNVLREDRNPIAGNATTAFIPAFTDTYTIIVTTTHPGVGDFTLTVREQGRMKPPVR